MLVAKHIMCEDIRRVSGLRLWLCIKSVIIIHECCNYIHLHFLLLFESSWFELGFSQLLESFWIIKKGNIPCREEQKGNKNQLEIDISLEVILNQKHSQK